MTNKIKDCFTCLYGDVEDDALPMDKKLSTYNVCEACCPDDDISWTFSNWCPIKKLSI